MNVEDRETGLLRCAAIVPSYGNRRSSHPRMSTCMTSCDGLFDILYWSTQLPLLDFLNNISEPRQRLNFLLSSSQVDEFTPLLGTEPNMKHGWLPTSLMIPLGALVWAQARTGRRYGREGRKLEGQT